MDDNPDQLLSKYENINSVEARCKQYARQIWSTHPELTAEQMLERHEIKHVACEGKNFDHHLLLAWILPPDGAGGELPRFEHRALWRIEEAVAIWLDLNPFIFTQLADHKSYFMISSLLPALRENYDSILTKAKHAILLKKLHSISDHNLYFVRPGDFHEWATQNHIDGPMGGSAAFFEKCQERWQAEATREEKNVCSSPDQSEPNKDVHSTLTRPAIQAIFSKLSPDQWRGRFSREKQNGLVEARVGEKGNPSYNRDKLSKWLVDEGLYTPAEVTEALEGARKENSSSSMSDLIPSVIHRGKW